MFPRPSPPQQCPHFVFIFLCPICQFLFPILGTEQRGNNPQKGIFIRVKWTAFYGSGGGWLWNCRRRISREQSNAASFPKEAKMWMGNNCGKEYGFLTEIRHYWRGNWCQSGMLPYCTFFALQPDKVADPVGIGVFAFFDRIHRTSVNIHSIRTILDSCNSLTKKVKGKPEMK